MRKWKASVALNIADESNGGENKYTVRNEETNEDVSEEQEEESSDECVSQPSSDNDNDETEQPSEEPTEEPSENFVSRPSSDSENDSVEQPSEEPSEELDEERNEEPSEEAVSQPFSDNIDDNGCQSENYSNEKKRSLDATSGNSGLLQVYPLRKKCKQEQSLEPESDVGFALTDLQNKPGISNTFVNDEIASEQQERTGTSRKRRHSGWDIQPEVDGEAGEGDRTSKRRKTRWSADDSQLKILGHIQLPDFVTVINAAVNSDPEIRELNAKLLELNRKLRESEFHDDRPENERSPSPPPVFDNLGVRVNTRDVRFRKQLIKDRKHIISRLREKNPNFKITPYQRPRLYKKLYLPFREYPGYNFIGLIVGPQGNTKKRMEKETGAKLSIKGKGSVKDGSVQQKPDSSDNDDLHVLVEAKSQKSLDAAVRMVEELLNPERMNEHKHAQLRELAELKGMLKIVPCDICGSSSHVTASCPLTASIPGVNVGNDYRTVLTDFGGGRLTFGTSPLSGSMPQGHGNCQLVTSPSYANYSHPGVSLTPNTQSKCSKEVDDGKLYVGCLPQTVDDNQFRELFSPFGRIMETKVIMDRSTGFSKGYGFVKYSDPMDAAKAVAHMNGHRIDGKILAVRVAGRPPVAGPSALGHLPKYPGPAAVSQDTAGPRACPGLPGSMQVTTGPTSWRGPPGSMSDTTGLTAWPGPPRSMQVTTGSTALPGPPGSMQVPTGSTAWPGPPGSMHVSAGATAWPDPPGSMHVTDGATAWPGPPRSMHVTAGSTAWSGPSGSMHVIAGATDWPGPPRSMQVTTGPKAWPGPPGSMLPEPEFYFPWKA